MPVIRIEITAEVARRAQAAATRRDPGVNIWADVRDRYLQIRQRGGAADWLVKTRGRTRVIGDVRERHHDYLSVKAAREKAARTYAGIASGEIASPARLSGRESAIRWSWADLDREYQAMVAKPRWIGRRMRPSSAGTCDDIRLAFAKPPYAALHPQLLTALDRPTLNTARDQVAGHRQREKCVAYFKAAMTWAADTHPDESGLTESVNRWWEHLTAGDPDAEAMVAIEARRVVHRERKAALDVTHLGALLARHESYCAGRTGEEKISPGIRWGLWWVCYTANRRFSTVKLKRIDLLSIDELGEEGWGRAMWPADTMKAKIPFWLPLPPPVRDVAAGSIADWTQLVANKHGDFPTAWVFASTRRHGRDPDNADVSVYPNSLNRHLLRMREAGALEGLPYFSLHLARSVMSDFLESRVSPVAASLVLAHTLKRADDEASPTTRQYYLTSQRMDIKAQAMRAWSEALIESYLAAGGTMPAPRETARRSWVRPDRRPPEGGEEATNTLKAHPPGGGKYPIMSTISASENPAARATSAAALSNTGD